MGTLETCHNVPEPDQTQPDAVQFGPIPTWFLHI